MQYFTLTYNLSRLANPLGVIDFTSQRLVTKLSSKIDSQIEMCSKFGYVSYLLMVGLMWRSREDITMWVPLHVVN